MASWEDAADQAEEPLRNHMRPVVFHHEAHEKKAPNCISCHHESLQSCRECHTETGDEKGGFVRLESAMHRTQTNSSCIGCHRQSRTAQHCAGCHAAMPAKRFSEIDCSHCHTVDRALAKERPTSVEMRTALARKALDLRPAGGALPADDQIPEEVVINSMVDQYEPATLPHRRIVHALAAKIKDDSMARAFHTEQTTICMGCHHNSPAALEPPSCASCHGTAVATAQEEKPGLKGAYHGQCISCHRMMGIEKPKATECVSCHKKRT
jgi:hypothetical protein